MKRLILCLILSALSLQSQSISIFDIDTTNFPTMRAKFYAFDAAGNQTRPSASELSLSEDGIQRTITNISCPVNPNSRAISSVLVIDVSGSMSSGSAGTPNIELAKIASQAWVNGLPLGKSNCAITSFDGLNYLNQDFTTNRTRLLEAIDKLKPQGGTDYDMALLNPSAGGLMLSKSARYKKVIIILTDGQPNQDPNTSQIIAEANAQDCEIYAVTLGMPAPQSLKDITKATGGEYFENVTTIQDAELVYKKLLSITQKMDPCLIEWTSDIPCKEGLVNLKLQLQNQQSNFIYQKKQTIVASLEVKPSFFSFGKKLPSSTNDTTITITARNSDFIITGINRKYGSSDFSIVNTSFPITIPKNTSTNFTIRFNPQDSGLKYANFDILTNNCSGYFSVYGGFPKIKAKVKTLKLTKPNGYEVFIAGSDTLITWEGVAPSDTVSLDYSTDSGKTWKNITDQATNLKYVWKNIPLPTSSRCLLRVSQFEKSLSPIDSVISLIGHTQEVIGIAYSSDGSLVATASLDSTGRIWDANTGKLLFTLRHDFVVMCISFNPEESQVATASAEYDKSIRIWDANNGTLIRTLTGNSYIINSICYSPDGNKLAIACSDNTARILDANTGSLLQTLNGHNGDVRNITFNPDGSRIATASYDFTARIWDANSGTLLFNLTGHDYVVNSISYNLDGSKLATASADYFARIWDSFSGSLLLSLNADNSFVNGIAFDPNGSRVATGTSRGIASIFDTNKGILLRNLTIHKEAISSIAFSPYGNQVATASADNTAKIWNISEPILQSDTSDAVFSIVAPSPSSKDIDMKEELVGSVKDSLITDFVTNIGSYQFRVDSVYFTGVDANSFSLVSGFPKYTVLANSSKTAEVRFKPKRAGIHNAKVVIITPTDTLIQNITGVGVQPQLALVNNIINFGEVFVNKSKDTITATIKNIGNTSLKIKSIKSIGPNTSEFSILGGVSPFDFQANTSHSMTLRFSPIDEGRESGRIVFEYDGVGSPLIVQLFGKGVDIGSISATIGTQNVEAYVGEIVKLPITLIGESSLSYSNITTLSLDLEYNRTLLFPKGYAPRRTGKQDIDVITVNNIQANKKAGETLTTIDFEVALGSAQGCELTLLNPKSNDNNAVIYAKSGSFTLLGICEDGGARLINPELQAGIMSISPNPTNDNFNVEVSLIEAAPSELILLNSLGQQVMTILSTTDTGKHTKSVNTDQLSTGIYYLQLRTATYIENKVIRVEK